MIRIVLVGLVLAFAVSGQADKTDHAGQGEWTRIDHEGGGLEEGFTVDGKRHGFWQSTFGDTSYRMYYVWGRDMDNAFRIEVQDAASLRKLIDEAEVDVNDLVFDYGRGTLLHAATLYGRHDVMRELLSLGADPNLAGEGPSFSRGPPVWNAVTDGRCPNLKSVDILLQGGAEITVRRDSDKPMLWGNDTLLHALARVWECDDTRLARAFVRRLTSLGLDIDAKNDDGRTALNQAAVKARSISVVRALIENGADLNSRDQFGRTPLHSLAEPGEYTELGVGRIAFMIPAIYILPDDELRRRGSRIGLLLLRNGADPNLLDSDGKRPLDLNEDGCLAHTPFHRRLARQTQNK